MLQQTEVSHVQINIYESTALLSGWHSRPRFIRLAQKQQKYSGL
jgi:hypothetical protein